MEEKENFRVQFLHAIRRGHLQPGTQLPTHRDLSKQVGVAVSTISRAYAEATRRGLIGGKAGRGTFVLNSANDAEIDVNRDALRPLQRLYLPIMQRADAINLSLNEPMPDGLGERLREAIKELAAKPILIAWHTISLRRGCSSIAKPARNGCANLGSTRPPTTSSQCRAGRPRS